MKNLWNEKEASTLKSDLDFRVYTSNLLGSSDELVLHGGGNTSVKSTVNGEEILYVKGSGWDLVSIKKEGFAPVKLKTLIDMAKLEHLLDSDMVAQQKEAMIDKTAPNPSVEAILHAIIPFKYVDHTHSDAIVTISNSKTGQENIKNIFKNFLIVPYIMPGFILAREIYKLTKDINWNTCEGIILHNHGIFTFDNEAKMAYSKMIDAVSLAEDFLDKKGKINIVDTKQINFEYKELISLIEKEKGKEIFININNSNIAKTYCSLDNLQKVTTRGVLTPEHIIRTKRIPLVIMNNDNIQQKIKDFQEDYNQYFNDFATNEIRLNNAPNFAIIKDFGIISFGYSQKEADIINDICSHTIKAVLRADKLGGYQSISIKDSFDMEYWELEQIKLKK